MLLKKLLFAASLGIAIMPASAQVIDTTEGEDLMNMLDQDQAATNRKSFVTATFKATRIINGHSIENVGHGVLDFRISHRFGPPRALALTTALPTG